MPSLFPGMDPYLEHPDLIPDLRAAFCVHLREEIQRRLPEVYIAKLDRRTWIELSSISVNGVQVPHDECRENFVEIYAGRGQARRLVTLVEILSASAKTPGNRGRDLYLCKQKEIRAAKVHLVEIDFLRAGKHTTALPLEQLPNAGKDWLYHICVSRNDRLEVYPIGLRVPLPSIAVPLLAGDGGVTVDLQAVFTRCYDAGPYSREIDYCNNSIEPPLPAELAEWARKLVGG